MGSIAAEFEPGRFCAIYGDTIHGVLHAEPASINARRGLSQIPRLAYAIKVVKNVSGRVRNCQLKEAA